MSDREDPTVVERPGSMGASPPVTIGRFTIEKTLGEGGMGVVLLAHDATLDRRVAIKVLRGRADADTSEGRVRLQREAQAMAKLRHANVVTVYEAGVHDGQVFIVMELVSGGTLRAWLKANAKTAGWRRIVAMFEQAGRGLIAAHKAGLVHRDFKPDNVLIDEEGVAKVTDFGLAARDENITTGPVPAIDPLGYALTQTGEVMGTPRYMAPEQHMAQPTSARTDQFAFCVTLYEALYRRHPFSDGDYGQLRAAVLGGAIRKPPDNDVPDRVRDAVLRGLATNPDDRHASIADLLAVLVDREDPPIEPVAPPPSEDAPPSAMQQTVSTAPPPVQRSLLVPFVIGGAIIAILVAFVALRRSPEAVAVTPAPDCDCEVLAPLLAPGLRIVSPSSMTVPKGEVTILYTDGVATHAYKIVSRGRRFGRTLELPVPEYRPGFAFVAGGEAMSPFLIATTLAPEANYATATKDAAHAHARLPTAAEWEWAVKVGAIKIESAWEWTSTPATGQQIEVRGGDNNLTGKGGNRIGRARVRLAKTASSVPLPSKVRVDLSQVVTGPGASELGLSPETTMEVEQFLADWITREPLVPLRITTSWCPVPEMLAAIDAPRDRVEIVKSEEDIVEIVPHPDEAYRAKPGRFVCSQHEMHVLEPICFSGAELLPSSGAMVDSLAGTLEANPEMHIEVAVHSPSDLGAPRANALRAALIARGIAASRIDARGYGPVDEDPLFDKTAAKCPEVLPGEQLSVVIQK